MGKRKVGKKVSSTGGRKEWETRTETGATSQRKAQTEQKQAKRGKTRKTFTTKRHKSQQRRQ